MLKRTSNRKVIQQIKVYFHLKIVFLLTRLLLLAYLWREKWEKAESMLSKNTVAMCKQTFLQKTEVSNIQLSSKNIYSLSTLSVFLMVNSILFLNCSYVFVIGSSKQLRSLFPTGYLICKNLIVGLGSKPMGGIEKEPVTKSRISSNVTTDSPPKKNRIGSYQLLTITHKPLSCMLNVRGKPPLKSGNPRSIC